MTAYRPSPKLLEVLAYLREREVAGRADGYTLSVGVSDESDRIPQPRRLVLTPLDAAALRTPPGVRR